MVKIASYNCNSVRKNSENVKNVLNANDIVCLQELLLSKSDLPVLNDFNENFNHIAFVEDRESQGINEGRPSRGVAIFWRKCFTSDVTPILIDDRMIALCLNSDTVKILLLNVYLPCDKQNSEAFHEYRSALAKLKCIIDEQNIDHVLLMGDFNADPFKGRFWGELKRFTNEMSLMILNEVLPNDTFTYLCPAKNSTSWLDHVVCSRHIADNISNLCVDYDGAIFDHFPLTCELKLDFQNVKVNSSSFVVSDFVDWRKICDKQKAEICRKIDGMVGAANLFDCGAFYCSVVNCKNEEHHRQICDVYRSMKEILVDSTSQYCFEKVQKFKPVPGWSEYVKTHHAEARKAFLNWKDNGKPPEGLLIDNMKTTRSKFRSALDYCKSNEEKIKNENFVRNLNNKNYKEFWNDISKTKKCNNNSLNVIDNVRDNKAAANLFSKNFRKIFDKLGKNLSDADQVFVDLRKTKLGEIINHFTRRDVHNAIKKLKCSLGYDRIHSNHIKLSPESFERLIAVLFSSFLLHGFIALDILGGVINPTVKDRHGNLCNSDNYRPVMMSSVFLKLLEYCILNKIKDSIRLNDRQHGFRENYSTSSAGFVLKETVLSYINSKSNVYACFMDISKAFDTVSHRLLMKKLLQYGIPAIYVNVIKYWYSNQRVNVRYGSEYSDEWSICNGVRQGGVLSGLFFNIYIDSLLDKISNSKFGCRLGIIASNIIAYADDIVLLAPSPHSLQMLIDVAYDEACLLELSFNYSKSKCLIFKHSRDRRDPVGTFVIGNSSIEVVTTFKYLGYMLNNRLTNVDDISKTRDRFYKEFNCILRKFSFADIRVKLFLFKSYCIHLYGCELWFYNHQSLSCLKSFAVAYHKAIKKLLDLSYHESNHFACQEAQLLTFENLINKMQIFNVLRVIDGSCNFIGRVSGFLSVCSVLYKETYEVLAKKYSIYSLKENDKDAIMSRIWFVQNHEPQMRLGWE